MKNKYDRPLRKKCGCGKPIKNHHLLCDDCWGNKARTKDQLRKKDIIIIYLKSQQRKLIGQNKLLEERIQNLLKLEGYENET